MLSALTLDDQAGTPVVLHETTKRVATNVSGLIGVAPLRDSRRVRPQAHGGIDETRYEDGRIIAIEGEVMSTVSIEDAYTEFRTITAPMMATLDGNATALKWTEGAAGLQLQRIVRLAGEIDPPLEGGAAMLRYQAQFYAEDPRAYTQTLTTVTGAALSQAGGGLVFPMRFPFTFAVSGGGTVSFTNAGNRPTPPVFRIYGRAVNPQIVFPAAGVRIVLNGTVEAGTYLELDVAKRTIKIGGTSSRLNFMDAANSTWFELPANANSTLQLVAADSDGGARLDVLARSAYS